MHQTSLGRSVVLEGCVGMGPVYNQLALERIQILEPSDDARQRGRSDGVVGVTEWAWVRLQPGEYDLQAHLGQRVRIHGVVVNSGQNTIGTAGTRGYRTPSGDKSQAASREHYADKVALEAGRIARQSLANGTAAEVRVEGVARTGDSCVPTP